MKIPILTYHDLHGDNPPISLSRDRFEEQMRWLHRGGCEVISCKDLGRMLRSGQEVSERTVVLVFDDGFESVYTQGIDILEAFGFSATVMVVTGHVGGENDWPGQPQGIPVRPLMNWSQLGDLSRRGFEIGAHTLHHPSLTDLNPDDIRREVLGSREVLERKLGLEIDSFGYPYGCYSDSVVDIVGDYFSIGCTTRLGFVTDRSDSLTLERIDVNYIRPDLFFHSIFDWWMDPYLGFRQLISRLGRKALRRGWC